MNYQKAQATVFSFNQTSFMALSGETAALVIAALQNQLAGYEGLTIAADGESFTYTGNGGNKSPVTVTVNGVTYVYTFTNNGHKLTHYEHTDTY